MGLEDNTEIDGTTGAPTAAANDGESQLLAAVLEWMDRHREGKDGEPLQPGQKVARYQILKLQGMGGMGAVYAALDPELGRKVALKLIRPDARRAAELRARLLREARAMAQLTHPNVITVHDVGTYEGQVFVAMELVEGLTLRQWLAENKRGWQEVLRVFVQAGRGLAAAHAGGLVHRDFKPDNVLVSGPGRVLVTDFGLARPPGKLEPTELADGSSLDTTLTAAGSVVGTPSYMAPEQHAGAEFDARTDQFSFCVSLYRALYGQPPFSGSDLKALATEILHGRVRRPPASSDVPAWVRDVVLRGLSTRPDDRFASMDALLEALGDDSQSQELTGWSPPKRRRYALVVLALLVLASVAGGWWWRSRTRMRDAALARIWADAQSGQHEAAREKATVYLGDHPGDPEALTALVLIHWWLGSGQPYADALQRAEAAALSPAQRQLVRGLQLMTENRMTEATVFLRAASSEHPGEASLSYALGESLWHQQQLQAGVIELSRAFDTDPSWRMALHHVVEFHLAAGEPDELTRFAERLQDVDPSASIDLRAAQLIAKRRYDDAAALVAARLEVDGDSVSLLSRLAEAHALRGDIVAAEDAARRAFERSPVDEREWSGFTRWAEMALYRGDLQEYDKRIGERVSHIRPIVDALWRGRPGPDMGRPDVVFAIGAGPLTVAAGIEQSNARGALDASLYREHPNPELRALGMGLEAMRDGDHAGAAREFRHGLEQPSGGDCRMLLSHHLARAEHALGHDAAAAKACDEVLHPRMYRPYRAVLLPDCQHWTP